VIIQFSDADFLDLDLARLCAWLNGPNQGVPDEVSEILAAAGLSPERLTENPKISQLVSTWKNSSGCKPFRTPVTDWQEVPFLLNAEEKPVSAANAWFRYLWKRYSPKTVSTYAYSLFDFFQYLEALEICWKDVDDDTLLSYRRCQELSDSAHKKLHNGTRKLARNTIQSRVVTVGRFYRYATNNGYLEKFPLTVEKLQWQRPLDANFLAHLGGVQVTEIPIAAYRYSTQAAPIKSLPHETVWEWITSVTNERDRLMATLLYQTGIRREELVLWRVSEIPEPSQESDTAGVQFEILGKGRKKRLVRITPGNFAQLRHWLDYSRPRILKRCGITEDHGWVWISERTGHPLQAITLNHNFDRVSARRGIKINPHLFRHSFAMQKRMELHEDGIANPEKMLQVILGHSSVVTTISIYGDISVQEQAREADSNVALLTKLAGEN